MVALEKTREEGPRAAEAHQPACRVIEVLVAAAFGVPVDGLRAEGRGPASLAMARQVAMYLAHVVLGMTMSEIGRHFGRDRTTVAYACARVEDCRDDLSIERAVTFLEEALEICLSVDEAGR